MKNRLIIALLVLLLIAVTGCNKTIDYVNNNLGIPIWKGGLGKSPPKPKIIEHHTAPCGQPYGHSVTTACSGELLDSDGNIIDEY